MGIVKAFLIGWGLSAFGIVHLSAKVGAIPGVLAAITIATYVFIYTPMKKWSSTNTLVGAIPGRFATIDRVDSGRREAWLKPGAGICSRSCSCGNCRTSWLSTGCVARSMSWRATRCGRMAMSVASGAWAWRWDFQWGLAVLAVAVIPLGIASWPFVILGVALAAMLVVTGQRFLKSGERVHFRKFFLATLLYLPLVLVALLIFWRKA